MTRHLCALVGAKKLGLKVGDKAFFDTVRLGVDDAQSLVKAAAAEGVNVRPLDKSTVTVSFDETTKLEDVDQLFQILNGGSAPDFSAESLAPEVGYKHPTAHRCPHESSEEVEQSHFALA